MKKNFTLKEAHDTLIMVVSNLSPIKHKVEYSTLLTKKFLYDSKEFQKHETRFLLLQYFDEAVAHHKDDKITEANKVLRKSFLAELFNKFEDYENLDVTFEKNVIYSLDEELLKNVLDNNTRRMKEVDTYSFGKRADFVAIFANEDLAAIGKKNMHIKSISQWFRTLDFIKKLKFRYISVFRFDKNNPFFEYGGMLKENNND